ncbi:hypothetical protein Droror1_Dr00017199 [Drosera rotundifolia]
MGEVAFLSCRNGSGELKLSLVCLDRMVHNFIEKGVNEKNQAVVKCGRSRYNCFNRSNGSSDDGGEYIIPSSDVSDLLKVVRIDPRNEAVIARVSEGDKEDIDLAVKAAREAFDHGPWPRMPGVVTMAVEQRAQSERSALLRAERARTLAERAMEVAIHKRKRARFLMEKADLATYRAAMMVRIVDAAQAAESAQGGAHFLD